MSKTAKLKVFNAVRAGFSIPHKNPSMFLVSAIFSAIMSSFMYFTLAFYQPGEAPNYMSDMTGILSMGEYLLFSLFVVLTTLIGYAILSKMAYDSFYGKPEIFDAVSLSVRKLLPLIAMYILYFIIVTLSSILLILPGIYLSFKLFYSQYFILFDNDGVIKSLRSSWQVIKGNWWRTFALFLIWGILGSVSAFIVYLPRTTETIVYFVLYLLAYPWTASSFVNAYMQLTVKPESPSTPVEA